MPDPIYPVACPVCAESQNILSGGFEPYAEPFGKVNCMVCNHRFSRHEYLAGLDAKARALSALTGPIAE